MAEYEEQRHEGNGNGDSAAAVYPAPEGSPPAAANAKPTGFSDSADGGRSQHEAQPLDGRSSKSRERDREREKDKDRERDRDRGRDRRDRDRGVKDRDRDRHRDHRDRSERREHRDRERSDDRDRRWGHDSERRRDRDGHRRHRSRSRSPSKGHDRRSRSRSRSRSKSKRVSGFDQGPSQQAISTLAAGAAPGQLPVVPPVIPGMLPNMFNLTQPQFTPLVIQPQAMTQQATRHARRVYVGGLPPTANEHTVAVFFNQVMAAIGGNTSGPGDAVLNVYINHDKKFAFVEMRSVEEASNAMSLDGIMFEGAPVKVRRPTDYNPSLAAALGPSQPNPNLKLAAVGLTPGSSGGLEGPDRIFVGGLPYYFTEAQVRELLESFGPLRGFDLVKDRETGNSKGYAFCVYQDLNVTDIACAALNGIKMGDKTLTVRRANQGASQPRPEQESMLLHAQQQVQMQKLMYQVGGGALPTKVVCLTQVVSADELRDDEEYEDIVQDMKEEASRYGNLVKVVIPRPDPSGAPVAGVGRVFLEFADVESSSNAKNGMHGRKFANNQVVAVFYSETKFAEGQHDE
ncbi:splicing factor U2af large subunit A isoform X2 [Oryza brachyantha]|uniref:splicing factor U2af large subunit A isoform X2 n=1 Tax=Oryza brachyantha TaxID=4533 RepID=UPI001ADA7A78|nr:splicing factor U2af large subunit A isoform X2 [Oryza brachyantha]